MNNKLNNKFSKISFKNIIFYSFSFAHLGLCTKFLLSALQRIDVGIVHQSHPDGNLHSRICDLKVLESNLKYVISFYVYLVSLMRVHARTSSKFHRQTALIYHKIRNASQRKNDATFRFYFHREHGTTRSSRKAIFIK